ncbi:MAG: LacI family DNA-binding transcriptional regulator [Caulobacteraceae bacterium]|nr:LacI family DNA-binding transcriptional regulator [Caulobacter sp.]
MKTVSRVVNGERYVVADTRDRVVAAIRELGYSPNAAARTLSGRRSYLIGIFIDDPASSYGVGLHLGALDRCRERGFHLVLESVDTLSPTAAQDLQAAIGSLRLEGVILPPPVCDHPGVLALVEGLGVPYARIAPDTDPARSPNVQMDDRQAAFDMTTHLLALGHRRIGFVRGPRGHAASPRRLEGHRAALAAAGAPTDEALEAPGAFTFRSGVEAAERLLSLAEPPTAIFAANDDMALGVLSVAARRGVAVPDELSVAGFDDSPVSRVVWPQLTTIRQPNVELAAAAVDLVAGPDPLAAGEDDRSLAYTLLVRGSTGPAPGRRREP